MKKYFKIISTVSLILVACVTLVSCEEENYGSDVNEVTPFIFDFAGPVTVNLQSTHSYSVTPRGGSKYVWTVTGATAKPVDGAPHKMDVLFDQEGAAQVSVYEEVANGSKSEASMKTVNVLNLCDWTIEMQDFYQDGWNKAYIEVSFVGAVTLPSVTLELADGGSGSQTFSVPSGYTVNFTFVSGDWDEEISYQIYDASGTKVFEDGDQTGAATPTVGLAWTTTAQCP